MVKFIAANTRTSTKWAYSVIASGMCRVYKGSESVAVKTKLSAHSLSNGGSNSQVEEQTL